MGNIINGLSHICVYVSDIEKSVSYYREVLGFECLQRAEAEKPYGVIRYAFIKLGDCEIELIQKPNAVQKEDGPINHIALNVNNIENAMSTLKAKGVVFEADGAAFLPIGSNGMMFVLFRGPDGERLELNQQL